jgi:RNA polymerase subunit RPABC4/transcription elongation factor Spt4
MSILPQKPEEACRQVCRTCHVFLPTQNVHKRCPSCGGGLLEWWYYVVLSVYGRDVFDAANVLVTGPAAVQFFNGIPACNLRTAPSPVVERMAEQLTVLSAKHSILDIGVEIDEIINLPEEALAHPKLLLSGCLYGDAAKKPETRTLVSL